MAIKNVKFLRKPLLLQKGFTLVELAMTLVVSGIVISAISIIASGSHKYVIEGRKRNQLQQDFSLIDVILANNIQRSIAAQKEIFTTYADYLSSNPPQSSGSCLKLYFPSGDSSLFYLENTDFKTQNADLAVTNLVPDVVSNLLFTEATNSVQTTITLTQDGKTIDSFLTHSFRN